MKCEIISVGTELTTGQNLDTNSQWLSRALASIGMRVAFHTTVSDDLEDNVDVVRRAAARAGLVIMTGGLGPTLDDLTRDVLAKVANVELVFDEASFDMIKTMFARRNRPMPERNRVQAMFPASAKPIPNALGTAPGIWMEVGNAHVAALPGVPREMTAMFEEFVVPRLASLGVGGGVIVERRINTFGTGESHVEEMLKDLTARGRDPEVGITASNSVISLRIVAHAPDGETAQGKIEPVEQEIRSRLGELVFGTGDEGLHEVVCRLLAERRMTVATAESITAGQVAERLARVPGISEWLRGGVVAYTNEVKSELLGVSRSMLAEFGAVSGPVAEAMAMGARDRIGSDIAVSTTGLAGPGDGGEGKPVGTAFIGIAWAGGVTSHQVQWFGTRTGIQARVTLSALNELRLFLKSQLRSDRQIGVEK
ncbi:MAG: competence/damage-inducible protein A [Gemmataceae bacterium]|nr:competence/damage-inducible protein A [Gemmataceae bacterium]